jgi:hypothetical protein
VEVRSLVDRGLTGEALGREIERLRIEAIAAVKPQVKKEGCGPGH